MSHSERIKQNTSVQEPPKKKQKTTKVTFEEDKKQLEMYMHMHKQTCEWLCLRGFTDGKLQGYRNGYYPDNVIPAVDLEDLTLLCEYYQNEYHTGFYKGYIEGYQQGFDKRTFEHIQHMKEVETNKKTLEHIQSVGYDDTDAWEQFLNLEEKPVQKSVQQTEANKMGVSFLADV
jgi:hypothetical protein